MTHTRTLLLAAIGLLAPVGIVAENADSLSIGNEYSLHEVVVTGTRNATDIRHLPMTISVVARPTLEKRFEPSLLPALNEQVPGLFVTSRGVMGYGVSDGAAGGFSMRGMSGSAQMLVLIDGHPQYMGLFGHPISDSYQTMLAERVEVLRGSASVLYGSNAMGGVVNIVTRKQQADGVQTNLNVGAGSYGTVQTEATNRVRRGRFSSVISASYNRTDGHRKNMGFEQYGGYAKLAYDISNAWNVYGDVNITHFNASNPGTVTEPLTDNDSRITRGMASFALQNNYDRTSGALSFFYNWGYHKINDGYGRSKDLMLGLSWYQSTELWQGSRLTLGFDYQHFGGESWNKVVATGAREPGVDKKQDEVAGYADFRQDISTWLSLNAGIRVDHHSHVGTEWVPQGGYELSFTQHLLEGVLTYGANLYYINGDNLIMTIREDGRPHNVNSGKIENWGLETNVAYRINPHWNINANYSWVHMEHPVISAPEHKLYAGADFTQGRWNVSTGIQYIKGLYTSVITNGQGTEQTEDFVLWNLRASYRLCKYATLYVKGENLLAQRYEIMAGYPMPKATFMGGVHISF